MVFKGFGLLPRRNINEGILLRNMSGSKVITNIRDVPHLDEQGLEDVVKKFPFKITEHYLGLIDWEDPEDPIRRLIIPDVMELEGNGFSDPSNEAEYTVAPGLQHKYKHTALLLLSDKCASLCRYCFRKRIFIDDENEEAGIDISEAIDYLKKHKEVTNLVISGGDPLALSTTKLKNSLEKIYDVPHLEVIRIGSKVPAFDPDRMDDELINELRYFGYKDKKLRLVTHFSHPRELTKKSVYAITKVRKANLAVYNQTPIIRGVNDSPQVLTELFNKLSFAGIAPYYAYICRPAEGNKMYTVPIEEAVSIFNKAKNDSHGGVARTACLTMSHSSGKVEVVDKFGDAIFMRYHRAVKPEDNGRTMAFKSNPSALWFDDYKKELKID